MRGIGQRVGAVLALTLGCAVLLGAGVAQAQRPPSTGDGVPIGQISIQLYNFSQYIHSPSDLETVLSRLHDMGYKNVEPYSFHGLSPQAFRDLLDEYDLHAVSRHGSVNEGGWDSEMARSRILGQDYVGSAGTAGPGFGSYQATLDSAAALNRLGKRAVENGFGQVFIHNHSAEFTTKYNDGGTTKSAWQIIMDHTDPRYVAAEVDVFWAHEAGVDVAGLLEDYGDRIKMLHVKDGTDAGLTPVGTGDVDFAPILEAAKGHVRYYHIELDPPGNPPVDPFDAAQISIDNLRGDPAAGIRAYSPEFPDQLAGTIGPEQRIAVTNSGDAGLEISDVQVEDDDGASAGDFLVDGQACIGRTIAPGDSCDVLVRFAPARANAVSTARLVLSANVDPAASSVTLAGTSTDSTPPPPSGCTASDEFDGDALNRSLWSTIVRENPETYEVSGGALRITTEKGDLWMGDGSVKNIIGQATPAGDFTATTQVTIDAQGGSEQAGLMLYAGDDDYLKLGHIGRNGQRWFEFIVEQNAEPRFDDQLDRSPNLPADFPTTFQVRITRSGDEITGAYSTDEGATWTQVGRPVPADALADPTLGVFALTNDEAYVTEAAFDWVRLTGDGVGSGGHDDEFGGDELDGSWSVVRSNSDRLAVAGGALRITTANGDLYGTDRDNVENIVLQPEPCGDWEATTAVELDAEGGGEQGGLILYAGDDDYVKVGHIAKNGRRWFEFLGEFGGIPQFDGSVDATPDLPSDFPTSFLLRLTRAGDTLTAAYSLDGTSWTAIGRPRDVSALESPRVGLFAQTNDDAFVTEAAFDWFRFGAEGGGGEDTTAPAVRATVDGIPTESDGYLNHGTVTLTASDGGSGVDTVEYQVDGGGWQPYTEPFEVTGDGDHTVRYRATDKAGNTSPDGTTTVTVAATPECDPVTPEPGFTAVYDGTIESLADGWSMAGPGGFEPGADCAIDSWGGMGLLWYSGQELTAPYTIRAEWRIYSDDDNSGVFIGFPDPGDDPWRPVSEGYEIQIDPTDGDPTRTTGSVYSFQAPDSQARADALNPHGEWNVMEVAVDGTHITVSLNGTVINEYDSPHPERSVDTGFMGIQNDGAIADVSYRSVQIKGGGIEEPEDTTAPETDVALDPADPGAGGTYDGPVGVTLSATDDAAGSGVAYTEYRLDGGAWTRSDNTDGDDPFATAFTVSAEGDHEVEYRSGDAAGNVEATRSVAFSIAGDGAGAPSVQAFADPASGQAPLEVNFSATGLDPDGDELTYRWEFSDGGSSLEPNVTRTYAEAGTYTATVTATDPDGNSASDTVEVVVGDDPNAAPSVKAAANPATGPAPLRVVLSAQATDPDGPGSITYLWDFGDGGATAFGRTVPHTYREPGTYTATVTATDGEGAFGTAQVTVVVDGPPANQPPSVRIAATPRSGTAPLLVRFTSAIRDPERQAVSAVWDFGDGVKGGGPTISHTYTAPGVYTATLTVTDPGGETDSASVEITVTGAVSRDTRPALPAPAPAPPQPVPPPPAPAPGAGDVAGESESARYALRSVEKRIGVRRLARRGLRVRLRSTAATEGRARLVVGRKAARRLKLRTRVLASRKLRLRDAGSERVKLKLRRRAVRGLRRMDRGRLVVRLVLRLSDEAGNDRRMTRKIVVGGGETPPPRPPPPPPHRGPAEPRIPTGHPGFGVPHRDPPGTSRDPVLGTWDGCNMPHYLSRTSSSPDFAGFVNDAEALIDDPHAIAARLQELLHRDGWLDAEDRRPGDDSYRQHLLHVSASRRMSVVALVWRPGQRTPIHDHVSWCVVGVLQGLEHETRYRLTNVDGRRCLEPTGTIVAEPGHVEALVPPADDIHAVTAGGDELTISIHVYGADIERRGTSVLRRFDDLPVLQAAA